MPKTAQHVMPSDIYAPNARMVFLNSCNSTKAGSFANSFGSNNRLLMGWNNSVYYWESVFFGPNWWMNMFFGYTAYDAADQVGINGHYTNPSSEITSDLKINFVRGRDERL